MSKLRSQNKVILKSRIVTFYNAEKKSVDQSDYGSPLRRSITQMVSQISVRITFLIRQW